MDIIFFSKKKNSWVWTELLPQFIGKIENQVKIKSGDDCLAQGFSLTKGDARTYGMYFQVYFLSDVILDLQCPYLMCYCKRIRRFS